MLNEFYWLCGLEYDEVLAEQWLASIKSFCPFGFKLCTDRIVKQQGQFFWEGSGQVPLPVLQSFHQQILPGAQPKYSIG